MAYDEVLAARVRGAISDKPGIIEKKMFGGVIFMLNSNMACGIHQQALIVRVGPQGYKAALARPGTRPFDLTGRPMSNWVLVEPEGCASETELKDWVEQGLAFAASLPAK